MTANYTSEFTSLNAPKLKAERSTKKMKTTLHILVFVLLMCGRSFALSLVAVGITTNGTNQVFTLNQRLVSPEKLNQLTMKLGSLSSEQIILIQIDANTPADRLLAVLAMVKNAGLKNVCVAPVGGRDLVPVSMEILAKTNEFLQIDYGASDVLKDIQPVKPDARPDVLIEVKPEHSSNHAAQATAPNVADPGR